MSLSTIGDMSQFFQTSRNNTAIRTELQTLVQELTTGQADDLTKHLGAGQTNLAGLDRQLNMLGQFARSNSDTAQLLATMQSVLGGVESYRAAASGSLLTVDAATNTPQIENAGAISRSSFEATVQSLNTRYGDRALFGGNDLDANPLSDPTAMLDSLKLAVTTAGATSATDITIVIDAWFDTPAGTPGAGFEDTGYQGDTAGVISRSIDATQSVDIGVRADDQAVRDTLKFLAMGVIAGDLSNTLDVDTRRTLQQDAGLRSFSAASSLVGLQSRLGYVESQVEEASVRISAQQTSYGIARNEIVSVDPFETATRLQAVQTQLETHYTLTARLSRLSLTEYLR